MSNDNQQHPTTTTALGSDLDNESLVTMQLNNNNSKITDKDVEEDENNKDSLVYAVEKSIDETARENPDDQPTVKSAPSTNDIPSSTTSVISNTQITNNNPETNEVASTFPQRLMEILDDPNNAEIISWLPHGRAFVIYKKREFASDILPKYFQKFAKYSSFTRKLNRWGFVRVTRGPETGAYYHNMFQQNEHRLVLQMTCHSSATGTNNNATTSMKGSTISAATKRVSDGSQSYRSIPPDNSLRNSLMYPSHADSMYSYHTRYPYSSYPTIDQSQQFWPSSYGYEHQQHQRYNTIPPTGSGIQPSDAHHSDGVPLHSNQYHLTAQQQSMERYSQPYSNMSHYNSSMVPSQPNMMMDPQMGGFVPYGSSSRIHPPSQVFPYQDEMQMIPSMYPSTTDEINRSSRSSAISHQHPDYDEATTTGHNPLMSSMDERDVDPIKETAHQQYYKHYQQNDDNESQQQQPSMYDPSYAGRGRHYKIMDPSEYS